MHSDIEKGIDEKYLVQLVAELENYSTHPIAHAFINIDTDKNNAENIKEIAGTGITGIVDGYNTAAGNRRIFENYDIAVIADFGEAFESWFVNECFRLNHYYELDYEFSYLRTKDDAEVDLIIDRPGKSQILVEIKSAASIDARHIKNLIHFQKDFPGSEFICASRVKQAQITNEIMVLPWKEALQRIGLNP